MSDMVTTAHAAQRLGVHPSRVRALIASGALTATRAGNQWLIDTDSLDHQHNLIAAGATGRPFAPRIAWAAGALCDGRPGTLIPTERTRLRHRLAGVDSNSNGACPRVQRWLSRRAQSMHHYRISERDVAVLMATDGVLATGISTANFYDLGLGTGGFADAYVSDRTHRELVKNFVLIDSARGNLTLRVTDARVIETTMLDADVAPRLIAGVDLTEDTDTRTRSAGRALICDALHALRTRRGSDIRSASSLRTQSIVSAEASNDAHLP
ncbi:helix-turn-helix domain-containing protein [Mycobacterium sp. MAA66]|uniref:helix-turn-helix domain-containing protein n=1 Tax=Mycobacterium sp. MAA66 TaxID=3156297 RepID=UPI003517B27C